MIFLLTIMVAIILYVGKAVSPKKKLIDFFGNFSIMLKCLSISKCCYVLAALSFAFFTYCPSHLLTFFFCLWILFLSFFSTQNVCSWAFSQIISLFCCRHWLANTKELICSKPLLLNTMNYTSSCFHIYNLIQSPLKTLHAR